MRLIRKQRTWACALVLLAAATGARAASLDGGALGYTELNDVGNIGIAAVTLSIATQSSPRLLTYLGDDLRYDITAGRFLDRRGGGHTSFTYAGPSWQYQPGFLWRGGYIDFGSAVTYLSHSVVGDRDLGGHWGFTTHVTLGHRLGPRRRWHLGLRLQHTSNAGLYGHNPGLDAALVELAYRLHPRRR